MALAPGTRLGPYEITAPLGAGGMGEVCRARDPRLGREADRRADVWAFGAVAYEMLTGRRAFAGDTISDTLASVMRDEPDWSALPPGLSPRWRRLLERCLAKDARRRLQAIGEARIALEDLAAHPAEAAAAPGAAAELSIVPPGGQRVAEDLSYLPLAISPDGRSVACTVRVGGVLRLRLRRLDTREDVEIPETDGARNMFFSRDGRWIGFFDSRKMRKVPVRGGAPVELADALQDRSGTWLDDGSIVFSRNTTEPLYRIPATGGTPVAITTLDGSKRERTHRFPCALDGGPWVVFTVQTVASPGGYDDASIDAVSIRTGERRHLYKGAWRAVWAPGGHLVLARGSDLFAARVNPRDPRTIHDPVPVLADVSGDASSGAAYFCIADDGTLVWIPGGEPERTREVGWMDRAGRWTPTAIPPGPYHQLVLSPDGGRALVAAGSGGGALDLWLADLRGGGMNRLTSGARSGLAAWLPDGQRFVTTVRDSLGGERVIVRRLDGAGGDRELGRAPNPLLVTQVSPDGQVVLYSDYGLRAGRMHVAPLDGSGAARALPAEGDGYELAGRYSPDGRWLAYVSNKTGREEVCVRRFGGSGGSWQVSTQGGGGPRWGRDGRELFFVSGEILCRVAVSSSGDQLSLGQPEPMFEASPSLFELAFREHDHDAVGDRFLFTRPPRGIAERREIAVSLGWAARLQEKVRGGRAR